MRRLGQIRPESGDGTAAIAFDVFGAGAHWVRGIADMDAADLRAGRGGDLAHGDSLVDDRVVAALGDVIEHNGVVEDLPGVFQGQAMALEMRIEETIRRDEGETTVVQTKPETDADRFAVMTETHSGSEAGRRRQRRPAAIVAVLYLQQTQDGPHTLPGIQHQP